MVYKFECSLEKQDCAALYPSTKGRDSDKLPFTSQSCVRDSRLEGNIGRCGFPGAHCTVDSGRNNCAAGTYSKQPVPKSSNDLAYNRFRFIPNQLARMAHAEGQYHDIALPSYPRELELTPFDRYRGPGAPCWYNSDCNCESKTIHNS